MLFDDYNKIDLTLLPLEELDNYLKGDKLIKVLIDNYKEKKNNETQY